MEPCPTGLGGSPPPPGRDKKAGRGRDEMSAQTAEGTTEERLQQGILFKQQGEYESALEMVRSVIESEPTHARAYCEMGLILNFTGDFDGSIDALKQSVALDPTFLEARNHLALAYSMLGYRDEARAELEAVLEVDPANATALRHIVYFQ